MRICFACLLIPCLMVAKPVVDIALDRNDATYKVGQEAVFTVTVKDDTRQNNLLKTGTINCLLTHDGMTILLKKNVDLAHGNPFIVRGKLDRPGFLRLSLRGLKLEKTFGAAYEPEKIRPAAPRPEDFWSFWDQAAGIGKPLPVKPVVTKLDKARKAFDAFKVAMPAPDGTVYGFLTIPQNVRKPLPALVSVPGAGPGFRTPSYLANFVFLQINVHNYDPTLPKAEFDAAYKKANATYFYTHHGMNNRETAFYYRTIVGASRMVHWLAEQPYVDARRIGYYGSSQGGAFGLILGGLNRQFSELVCNVPALCDHMGLKLGRRSGWPQFVAHKGKLNHMEAVVPYFDAANFAGRIKAPVTVIVGFADVVCCPSSVYAAYSQIPSAKKIIPEIGMGHACRPSYGQAIEAMKRRLQGK